MWRILPHPVAPLRHQTCGVHLVALRLRIEIEGLVEEVVGPQRRQVGQVAQQAFGVALPVGVEGRFDEQHHFEACAVSLLDDTACGTEHSTAVHIAVKDIKADAYGIESPRGNRVKMFLNGATVIVVGRHHLERVAHPTDEDLVVEHYREPFFAVEDKVPVLKAYIAISNRGQRIVVKNNRLFSVIARQKEQATYNYGYSFHFQCSLILIISSFSGMLSI